MWASLPLLVGLRLLKILVAYRLCGGGFRSLLGGGLVGLVLYGAMILAVMQVAVWLVVKARYLRVYQLDWNVESVPEGRLPLQMRQDAGRGPALALGRSMTVGADAARWWQARFITLAGLVMRSSA